MNKIRWIFPTALVAAAILVPAGSSSADENAFGVCPDGYQARPAFLAVDEDKNGNGVVCTKPTNGQTHDDPNGQRYACNGLPTPPPECAQPGVTEVFIGDDIV